MLKKLEQISSEIIYSNPYWQYGFDVYTKPDGKSEEYHYVNSLGSVMIIPKAAKNSFVLLRQYRYLNCKVSIEFPGGGIPMGADAKIQAHRELQEEAGFAAGSLLKVGQFNPCNGITNELCSVYYADELHPMKASPEESEEFEIFFLSAEEIDHKIRTGEIWDGMTICAWHLFIVAEFNS